MAVPSAFYDANVLYPSELRNFLMHLALTGLFRAKWSAAVHEEWISNLLKNRPDLTREKLERTRQLMDKATLDALVEGYEDLIPAMTNHPKDRHVLAAAARAGVKVIVTYNLKDFPPSSLAPYSITAQGPSAFLKNLYNMAPSVVMQTLDTQAAAIGQTMTYLLSRLRINVPAFVAMVEETLD